MIDWNWTPEPQDETPQLPQQLQIPQPPVFDIRDPNFSWDWDNPVYTLGDEEEWSFKDLPYYETLSPGEQKGLEVVGKIGTAIGGISEWFTSRKELYDPDTGVQRAGTTVVSTILDKGLYLLDILAEGIERGIGMAVQADYAAKTGTTNEFLANLDAAWKAAHFGWNIGSIDLLNFRLAEKDGQFNGWELRVKDFHGPTEIVKIRRMFAQGMSKEQIDEAMMKDWGALWFKGHMGDAIMHIAGDPMNWVGKGLLTAGARWAASKVNRFTIPEMIPAVQKALTESTDAEKAAREALEIAERTGATAEDIARLESTMSDAATSVENFANRLSEVEKAIPNRVQRRLLKVFGQWAPDVADAHQGLKWYNPFTWFRQTSNSAVQEFMFKATDQLKVAISNAQDEKQLVAVARQTAGALANPMAKGFVVSPAGRSLQAVLRAGTGWMDELIASYESTTDLRRVLTNIHGALRQSDGTLTLHKVLKMLAEEDGIPTILKQLEGVAEASGGQNLSLRALLQVDEAGEALMSERKLKEIVAMFADSKVPYNFETLKLHMVGRVADAAQQLGIAKWGIEETGIWTKAAAALKSIETVAFLRTNPGYLARNFINNEFTMAARGVWNLSDATKTEAQLMKMWERMDIMEPARLRSGFTMADDARANAKAMEAAESLRGLDSAESALRSAARSEYGWLDKISDTISGINLGPFDMGSYASRVESWASIRAYSLGMERAWQDLWQSGKGFSNWQDYLTKQFPGADLGKLGETFTEELHSIARSSRNMDELREGLYANLNTNWDTIVSKTAERIGIDVNKLDEFLGPEVKMFMEEKIVDALKINAKPEEIQQVIWETNQLVQTHLDDMVKNGADIISHQTYAMFNNSNPQQAFVYLYGRQLDEYHDAYEVHLALQEEIMRNIRRSDLPWDAQRTAHQARVADADRYWARITTRQAARSDAIEQAMSAGVRIDPNLRKAYEGIHSANTKFYEQKNKMLDTFFGRDQAYWAKLEEGKGLTRADEYARIQRIIQKRDAVRQTDILANQQKLNQALLAQIEAVQPWKQAQAEAWLETTMQLQRQHMDGIRNWYEVERPGLDVGDDLFEANELFKTKRLESHNLLMQAQREGFDSMVTGLPFGANHTLDSRVREVYLTNLIASNHRSKAREVINFTMTENNPELLIRAVTEQLQSIGYTVRIETSPDATFWGYLDFPKKELVLHEDIIALGAGDPAILQRVQENARKFLDGTLEDVRSLTNLNQHPGRAEYLLSADFDPVQLLRETLVHELVHYHQELKYINGAGVTDYTFGDPGMFRWLRHIDPDDIAYGEYSEIFRKLYKATSKNAPDEDYLDLFNNMQPRDLAELVEWHARVITNDAMLPEFNREFYQNENLMQLVRNWQRDHPEIWNSVVGRGRFSHSTPPIPLAPEAVRAQAKMASGEIWRLYQANPEVGSYSMYYLRNMTNTDGYAVVVHDTIKGTVVHETALRSFINENADLLADPRNMVGWWQDSKNQMHLEISTIVADRTEALKLGKTYNQDVIYGLARNELIEVKGNIKAYDYSINPLRDHAIQMPGNVAGPPTSGPAMDLAFYQRLNPDQMPNAAALDTLWSSQGSAFVNRLGNVIDEQRAQRPLLLEDKIATLPIDQQQMARNALNGWVQGVDEEMRSTKLAAMTQAEWYRDSALLNYHNRTYFDHYAGNMFPFAFWTTHSVWNWFWWSVLEKPQIFSNYMRINNFVKQYGGGQLPSRFHGYNVPIKLPFLPEWMGDTIYINPIRAALPFDYWVDQFVYQPQNDALGLQRRAQRIIERGIGDNQIGRAEGDQALKSQSGPIWDTAIKQAEDTSDGDDFVETMSYFLSPHAPALWAYHMAKGQPEKISTFLPATRTIKGITALLGAPNGGVNIEGWIREKLGLPRFDQWEGYQIERMLANMTAEGELSHPEAMRAMTEGKGNTWYDIANERAGAEYGIAALGSALGVPMRAYPPGEEASRNLVSGLYDAYDLEDQGQVGAVNRYFNENPAVATRLALFQDPQERLQRFLIDEVWDKYMNLPTLHKREVRETFGEHFQYYFLNSETRAETEIPIEMLAVWLKLLGGDPPNTLKEADQVPPMPMADPAIANRAQVFYDTRERDYPNWYEEQSTYYSITEDNWAEKKKYRDNHPDLVDYWEWRRGWLSRNPDVAGYITDSPVEYESQQEAMEARQNQPDFTWREWNIVLPPSLFWLIDDALRGEALPQEARDELAVMAQSYGLSVAELMRKLKDAYYNK